MKKILTATALFAFTFNLNSSYCLAQTPVQADKKELKTPPYSAPAQHKDGAQGFKQMAPEMEKRMKEFQEKLWKDLGLTDAQKKVAEQNRINTQKELEPIRQKMEDLRTQTDQILNKEKEQFKSILTPEQKEKFEAIEKERKAKMEAAHEEFRQKMEQRKLEEAKPAAAPAKPVKK